MNDPLSPLERLSFAASAGHGLTVTEAHALNKEVADLVKRANAKAGTVDADFIQLLQDKDKLIERLRKGLARQGAEVAIAQSTIQRMKGAPIENAVVWADHYEEGLENRNKQLPATAPVIAHDELSMFFGLSYARWLTIPRVVLEAMPNWWTSLLGWLLNLLPDWCPVDTHFYVVARDSAGKYQKLPAILCNYRHPDRVLVEKLSQEAEQNIQFHLTGEVSDD